MTATATRTAFAPVAVRATSSRSGSLRLTRRGRLLLTCLVVLGVFLLLSVGRAGSQAATVTATDPALVQMTVQPGDTLWAIAQRIAPNNDPREVMAQIRRINDLSTPGLLVGQQLLLPTPAS